MIGTVIGAIVVAAILIGVYVATVGRGDRTVHH